MKPDKVDEAHHPAEAGYLGAVAIALDPNAVPDHVHQPNTPENATPGLYGIFSSKVRLNGDLAPTQADYPGVLMQYSAPSSPPTLS